MSFKQYQVTSEQMSEWQRAITLYCQWTLKIPGPVFCHVIQDLAKTVTNSIKECGGTMIVEKKKIEEGS